MKISSFKQFSFRRAILPASIIAAMAMSGSANAFKVETDNEDLDIRFDNTVRYTAGWRMQDPANYGPGQTASGAGSIFVGASESKWDSGDMVTNRIDVLSEFDFIFKKDTGFRVSGALWYDQVYNGNAPNGGGAANLGAPIAGQIIFPTGKYNDEVKRWYNQGAEFLDAFVFTKFDLGSVPVNVKLGQHNIYWGEAIFSLGSGVSYSQAPLDIRKAVLSPGIEAKEVFLPLPQFSFSAQISPELTIMGQYFLDWDHDRLMLGGTYTSFADMFGYSGNNANPFFNWAGTLNKPKDKTGDWGIAARWRPEWLDGTAGFYYREFTPKSYLVAFDLTAPGGPAGGWAVDTSADRTKLYGLSLAKQIWGISWGAELVYKTDLAGGAFLGTPIAGANFANWAPRMDVWSGLVNMIAYDGKRNVPFTDANMWDSAVLTAEIQGQQIDKVKNGTSALGGPTLFGAGSPTCALSPGANVGVPDDGGARGGCSTEYAYGVSFLLEPKWFQVWPGTDVTMPIVFSKGLHGNTAYAYDLNEGVGSFSVGLTADVDAKYNFALKYNGYIGKHNTAGTGVAGNANSALGDFSHKGWLSFTAKATW